MVICHSSNRRKTLSILHYNIIYFCIVLIFKKSLIFFRSLPHLEIPYCHIRAIKVTRKQMNKREKQIFLLYLEDREVLFLCGLRTSVLEIGSNYRTEDTHTWGLKGRKEISIYLAAIRFQVVGLHVGLLSHVQLFCNPMDCSPLGSTVHGTSQARTLEWVAISFSRGSSWLRDRTHVSCIGRRILCHWTPWESMYWAWSIRKYYFIFSLMTMLWSW